MRQGDEVERQPLSPAGAAVDTRVRTVARTVVRACAGALAGLLLLAAPAAAAAAVEVQVSPSTAEPGEAVTVLTTCDSGEVRSPVFPSTELSPISARTDFRSSATVTVDEHAEPSVYGVEAHCDNGESGVGELVVLRAEGPPTGAGSAAGGTSWPMVAGGAGLLAVVGVGWLTRRRIDRPRTG